MLNKISEILGEEIIKSSGLGGGCIADSQIIETEKGNFFFLKSYIQNPEMAKCEANGLLEIAKSDTIKVPDILAVKGNFLLLEYIHSGNIHEGFFENFGRLLADLHKVTSDSYGFYENNFIGSNSQINLPRNESWSEFYWENRLVVQYKLTELNGYADEKFTKLFKKLEKKFFKILEEVEENPSLLHGDLWSGNFIVNEKNQPILIDPAVYYGNREAELAMTKMFGGFGPEFYSAYNEVYPLEHNWNERIDLYKLYHVLNHINLFGYGYYNEAIHIMQKYV